MCLNISALHWSVDDILNSKHSLFQKILTFLLIKNHNKTTFLKKKYYLILIIPIIMVIIFLLF